MQPPSSNANAEVQSTPITGSTNADEEMRDAPAAETDTNTTTAAAQGPNHAQPQLVMMFPPPITFFTTLVSETHVPPLNAYGPRGPPAVAHIGMNFFYPPVVHVTVHGGPTSTVPPPTGVNTPGQSDNTAQENAQTQPQDQQQEQVPPPPSGIPMGGVPFPGGMGFIGALLSSVLNGNNPATMSFGDAVYSQEALDRIISQLREQAGPGGAPPASQSAIDKLEVRELDETMLGGESKSRCVICVDEMSVGDKASVLPCNHFFHGECVTPWLKQHNTCPVCRRSIEPETEKLGKGAEFAHAEADAAHHSDTAAGCL